MRHRTIRIYQWLNDAVVFCYKIVGYPVLATLMIWTVSYLAVTGFFLLSNRWALPFIAGPGHERVIREDTAYNDQLRILNQLKGVRSDISTQLSQQTDLGTTLGKEFTVAMNALMAQEEINYIGQKLINPLVTKAEDFTALRRKVEERFERRLINADQRKRELASLTKEEWGFQRKNPQAKRLALENQVAQFLVTDDRDAFLDALLKWRLEPSGARIVRDLLDINTRIKRSHSEIESLSAQAKRTEEQIRLHEQLVNRMGKSPFVKAAKAHMPLAFVPYGNAAHVSVGASVYGCALYFFACREIGTVAEVFANEELTWSHPLFKTSLRGNLVRLEVLEGEEIKKDIVILDRPPLLW